MIYAIGDIHGKAKMLERALYELQFYLQAADTVVFLGDYIDRGEDSRGVIEAVLAFKAMHENTICLRGNHEQMFLEAYFKREEWMWLVNGGDAMLRSYRTLSPSLAWRNSIPAEHLDFFNQTEMEWEAEKFYFVHAGLVPPSLAGSWGQVKSDILEAPEPRLWIRKEFINSEEDFGKIVVFGHTIQLSGLPLIQKNKLGLDTGAFNGGYLTVAVLDDDTTDCWYFRVSQDLRVVLDVDPMSDQEVPLV